MAYTKDQQDYATAIALAKREGKMDLVQKYTQAQSAGIPFGETESRIKQFSTADIAPKDDWGDYFTKQGSYNDNREQLLKYRKAGISKSMLEQNPLDVGGGFVFDPVTGTISGDNFRVSTGGTYAYTDPRSTKGSTLYNGFDYIGQYDPNVIREITEEDWSKATANRKSWLDWASAQDENFTSNQYLRDLAKAGGLAYEDSPIKLTTDQYQSQYGKMQDETYNAYQNYLMEDAYAEALKRYQGDPNLIKQIRGGDYTDYYKSLTTPSSSNDMFTDWLSQYAQLVAPKQEQKQIVQPKTTGLEEYSNQRDQLLASGASQEQLDSLRSAYESMSGARSSTTPSPVTPSTPEPASTAMNASSPWSKEFESSILDLGQGFKTSLDDYIKTLSKPVSSNQPSFTLSSVGDTGTRNSGLVPTAPQTFGSNNNQTASPYTGKAGQSNTTTANQQALWR